MASEYTSNYNLDLYTDTDKPNLRDQYNAAMNKIDAALVADDASLSTMNGQLTTINNTVTAMNTTVQTHTTEINALQDEVTDNTSDIADHATLIQNNQQSIQALNTRCDDTDTALTNLADSLTEVETTVGDNSNGLVKAVNDNTASISDIYNMLENVSTNNVVLIGDSWGQGYSPDGNVTSWITLVKNVLTSIGIESWSSAVGGAGVVAGTNYSSQLDTLAGQMTEAERESVGVVLCGGGFNDNSYTSQSSWTAPLSNLISMVTNRFPNARLVIDWFGNGLHSLAALKTQNARMFAAYRACEYALCSNIAARRPILVYGLDTIIFSGEYASDGYHPNQTGQYYVAQHVLGTLFGNCFSRSISAQNINLTPSNATSSNASVLNTSAFGVNTHSYNSNPSYYVDDVMRFTDTSMTFNGGQVQSCSLFNQNSANVFRDVASGSYNCLPTVLKLSSGYYDSIMVSDIVLNSSYFAFILFARTVNAANNNYLSGTMQEIQFI